MSLDEEDEDFFGIFNSSATSNGSNSAVSPPSQPPPKIGKKRGRKSKKDASTSQDDDEPKPKKPARPRRVIWDDLGTMCGFIEPKTTPYELDELLERSDKERDRALNRKSSNSSRLSATSRITNPSSNKKSSERAIDAQLEHVDILEEDYDLIELLNVDIPRNSAPSNRPKSRNKLNLKLSQKAPKIKIKTEATSLDSSCEPESPLMDSVISIVNTSESLPAVESPLSINKVDFPSNISTSSSSTSSLLAMDANNSSETTSSSSTTSSRKNSVNSECSETSLRRQNVTGKRFSYILPAKDFCFGVTNQRPAPDALFPSLPSTSANASQSSQYHRNYFL